MSNAVWQTLVHLNLSTADTPCEARHAHRSRCSGGVTHRKHISCTGEAFNICNNSRALNDQTMSRGSRCTSCGKRAAECWKVVPV